MTSPITPDAGVEDEEAGVAVAPLPAIIDGPCGPEWGPMIAKAKGQAS